MLVKVKNKTNRTINLASGPLHPFRKGFASQAEASNMYADLEWLPEDSSNFDEPLESLEPEEEPEPTEVKRGRGRPRKDDEENE